MDTPQVKPSEVLSRLPLVEFQTKGIAPPSTVYIGPGERLLVRITIRQTGHSAVIRGRYFRAADGLIIPIERTVTLTGSYAVQLFTFDLAEGYLLSVTVKNVTTSIQTGDMFVEVSLLRDFNQFAVPNQQQVLISGYTQFNRAIGWPGGPMKSEHESPGTLRSITGSDPAANTEFNETVPVNARWKLHSIFNVLVTDANVANRIVELIIDDGGSTLFRANMNNFAAAGQTARYCWSSAPRTADGTNLQFNGGLPTEIILQNPMRFRSNTTGLQVGDNWTAPQFLVTELVFNG